MEPISVSGSAFVTAWGLDFSTALTATTAIPAGRVFVLRFDAEKSSYISVSSEFVSVQQDANGKLVVTALKDIAADTVFADLTFKAADDLKAGTHTFLFADESANMTGDFAPIVIYQMGDVNLDGNINSRDALMIKQYVVKMIELTDAQKVYANVYNDFDNKGNPLITSRDAMLLQQYIVMMDVTLDNRGQ